LRRIRQYKRLEEFDVEDAIGPGCDDVSPDQPTTTPFIACNEHVKNRNTATGIVNALDQWVVTERRRRRRPGE
jgi:hypothetical protein